jgi:hypothetical protein
MKTLEKFKSKNLPEKRVSRLEEFRTEIFELYEENYTIEQIKEFLKIQGVIASQSNLYKFLTTNKEDKKSEKKPKVAQKNEPIKEAGEMSQATKMFLEKHLTK